jgi:NarL family two-component system response regulator LiaR
MAIKLFLVDNHRLILYGLHAFLDGIPDMEIVGEALNGPSAIELTARFKPDVVIMDLAMRDMNSFEVSNQIIQNTPDIKILALSTDSDKRMVNKAFQRGLSGFISKNCTAKDLSLAIRIVYSGRKYFSPEVVNVVVRDNLATAVFSHN